MRIMIIPAVQSTNRSGPRSKCAAALRHLGIHRGAGGGRGGHSHSPISGPGARVAPPTGDAYPYVYY